MSDVVISAWESGRSGNVETRAGKQISLEKVAKEFESVFMAQMLKPMWEGITTDETFGGGPGEDVMRDMLIQEYGKSMVRGDRFGLSPAIVDAMIKMQETASSKAGGSV